MSLQDLASYFSAEERAEIRRTFDGVQAPGTRLAVKEEALDVVQRSLVAMALCGVSSRLRMQARASLEQHEAEGRDLALLALQSALKARIANPSSPAPLLDVAECYELAGRVADARETYSLLVEEQSKYPEDPEGPELVALAKQRIADLERAS